MDAKKRLELIKRNTSEIIGEKELEELFKKKGKPSVYLGTAITGSPHIAYLSWAIKMADFLKAGFKVKLLLADLHGALDGTSWDILGKRYKYYEKIIPLLFESLGVSAKGIEFVKGSSFQRNKDFFYDLLRLSTVVSVHDSKKAASDVVKLGDNPRLAGLIYPLMQALDEEYLGVDVQYGGLDQRKIFVMAAEGLPKIGYKKRIHVMTPILPGLIGEKMSATSEASKIDLLDDEKTVERKIRGAEMVSGDSSNGVMAFLKHVIFVVKGDKKGKFVISRDKKYGGNLEYKDYESLEKDFVAKKVHPLDLKNAVAREINSMLAPVRKKSVELKKLHKAAFK